MEGIKKPVLVILCFIVLLSISVSADGSINQVSIKVFCDPSYTSAYGSSPNEMTNTMTSVSYPFRNQWGISMSSSRSNISGLPLENCPLGYYSTCSFSSCNANCSNSSQYITQNHHKNFNNNCAYAKDNFSSGYDIRLLVCSATLCHRHSDGTHDTCGIGMVPYAGDSFAMVRNSSALGYIVNRRVIQHELSHCFGCHDNGCSPGELCIMSGGFDTNSRFYIDNIWCTKHKNEFNRLLH